VLARALIPSEIRVNPAARNPSSIGGDTVSGLASIVTSAPASRPNAAPISSRSAPSSGGGSTVGVPPPKNTVETGGAPGPRTRRANRISASAART